MKNQPIIAIENLTVAFDNVTVLDSINLQIFKEDYFAIIGPNGGGKSVLVKTILGLIKPTTGSITFQEKTLNETDITIGYVPQVLHYDIAFPITALEVVQMGRLHKRGLGIPYNSNDMNITRQVLKEVGISEKTAQKPFPTLSGGQKQRILIARALASEPELLILDEPTASIDPASNEKINELFSQLHKEGKTVLITTHDIGAISKYITKVACLNRQLFFHGEERLSGDDVKAVYGCNIDLIAHGIPHRVLEHHKHK